MRSKSLALLLVLLAVAGFQSNAIAQDKTPSIAGTQWVGPDADDTGVTTLHFEKGGVLSYAYGGNSYRNATWWQDGDTIGFQMNNGYRVFTGTVDGDRIAGESKNVRGDQWLSTFYLFKRPKCDRQSFDIAQPCPAPAPRIAGKTDQ
jgi:hypothetical protein